MGKTFLKKDLEHFKKTHNRWIECINLTVDAYDQDEAWYQRQCFSCVYYVSLSGKFAADWGVCTNESSPFDRKAMFEHDGCYQHEQIEEWPDEEEKTGEQQHPSFLEYIAQSHEHNPRCPLKRASRVLQMFS